MLLSYSFFTVDLFVCFTNPPENSASWPRHTIDDSSTGADGVKLADWNQDGWLDIVTGWEEGGLTRVYLHPGPTQVKKQWPQETVGQTPDVEDAVFVDLAPAGPLAVLSCTEGKTKQLFLHWPLIGANGKTQWQQQSIPAANGLMQWMYAVPFQLNSNTSTIVAAGKGREAAIGWFALPEDTRAVDAWKWHNIGQVGWIMSIIPADMDRDGDLDLLLSDRRGALSGCRWLENPGPTQWKEPWPSHWIGAQGKEIMFIDWQDLDGDGHNEILAVDWTDTQLNIFSLPASPSAKATWTARAFPLPTAMKHPKSVTAGDLNGDGIFDLVVSSNTQGAVQDGLVWLDGRHLSADCQSAYQSISGAHNAKYDKVELLDIDRDGDLDILICEENHGPNSEGLGVIWYENLLN